MTDLILQAKPFVRMAAPTVRSICDGFLKAMDSFAAERLRNAVPVQARRTALGRTRRTQTNRTRVGAARPAPKSPREAA